MNNEQKKEIEFLKKRISILENELKEKDKKNDAVWPAAAAQRKRVAEFCKAHNITPTEAERKKLIKVAEHLELMLRQYVPSYRYGEYGKGMKKAKNSTNKIPGLFDKEE